MERSRDVCVVVAVLMLCSMMVRTASPMSMPEAENSNEELRGTDALVSSGLAKLGYIYVNIAKWAQETEPEPLFLTLPDDCWAEMHRDAKGNLLPKNSTFPSGIKALADYVHSKGLKLGIYSDAG
ncbi:alpha-galactosidase [Quercus suber]|uniref:Alpha-galactosidase n=1 Tax=Quercus suber TaxID=58331 RepID=A0AAW0JTK1_QUESU